MEARAKWIRVRIRVLGIFFTLVFTLLVVRAFDLQVLGREEWINKAEKQRQRIVPLAPQRGTIYDANGEELAVSTEVDSIYLSPKKGTGADGISRQMGSFLGLPESVVKAKFASGRNFVWLKRHVAPQESEAIRSLKVPGVHFVKEHRRFYPNSEIGAQVIGFTGLDPEGLEGLELKYDSELLGRGGFLVTEKDALGRSMGDDGDFVREGVRGNDLYLTIDKNLQYVAERELSAGVERVKAKAGSIVVIEPQTGKVLAMANYPQYNPNSFSNHRPDQWRNRAVCDMYEPGSTFKIFLLASAIEEKVVGENEKIDCEKGSYDVGGKVVHDHHPYGKLTIEEILKYSSNIGVAKIASLLGRERLHDFLRDFGFGSRTGVDLPGESSGLLRDSSQWFDIDLAAIAFGQGVSVTPLQLALAASAIANGGVLMAPYVVERVVDQKGDLIMWHSPKTVRRVVSKETARRVLDMMLTVTESGGTGTLARIPGYRVGGKTGTAQKVDPVTGGYSADKRVASFIGFAPAEAPRLVVLVSVDEPKEEFYGGLVAAPIFSNFMGQALTYLKVPPDRIDEPLSLNRLQDMVTTKQGREKGRVVNVMSDQHMPDCLGMSCRQILKVMDRSGLNISIRGSGRVVEQYPSPGDPIIYGNEVWVRLAPPT